MIYRVCWHDGVDSLDNLKDQYIDLVSRCRSATLFNDWAWIRAAAASDLLEQRQVRTLTIHKGRDLVGCLPLTWGREFIAGVPVRTLRALGYPLSDRIGIPVSEAAPGVPQVMAEALADPKLARADVTILSELPSSAGYRDLFKGAADRYEMVVRLCGRAPILRVLPAPYQHETCSKGLRTRIKRARQKMQGIGSVNFERRRPHSSEVPALLQTIAAIEDRSWKGKEGVGIFSKAKYRAFFHDVAIAFAERGCLEVLLLTLDGKPISYRFGFLDGSTFLDYNFAYPDEFASFSVGRVLLADAINTAHEAGLTLFDASRGSLSKPNILQDWTSNAVEHDELWLFADSLWGRILGFMIGKLKPAAKQFIRTRETA